MVAVACAAAWGAARPAGQEPIAQFSSGVQLVEVYVTVTDAKGALVTGLRQSDFEVSEDGAPQRIEAFAAGEFPLTVVLGVDRSWSMAGEPLRLAKAASQTFLRQLRPSDRPMVVAIGSDAEVLAPLSNDHERQIASIAALDPWSTTSLHDAIISTLDRLDGEKGRLALVVFSDGVDRYSEASASQVVDRARRSQTLVYAITLGRTPPPLAAELAVVTGGRSFLLRDARGLAETFSAIAQELRFQYLIGYTPASPPAAGTSGWRSIRVRLKDTNGLRIRARDGYFAGGSRR
jgi:Ca-activated chloride channel family protein